MKNTTKKIAIMLVVAILIGIIPTTQASAKEVDISTIDLNDPTVIAMEKELANDAYSWDVDNFGNDTSYTSDGRRILWKTERDTEIKIKRTIDKWYADAEQIAKDVESNPYVYARNLYADWYLADYCFW